MCTVIQRTDADEPCVFCDDEAEVKRKRHVIQQSNSRRLAVMPGGGERVGWQEGRMIHRASKFERWPPGRDVVSDVSDFPSRPPPPSTAPVTAAARTGVAITAGRKHRKKNGNPRRRARILSASSVRPSHKSNCIYDTSSTIACGRIRLRSGIKCIQIYFVINFLPTPRFSSLGPVAPMIPVAIWIHGERKLHVCQNRLGAPQA
jgi:hypothetical protein